MFSPSTSTVAAKRRESTTRTRAGGIVCVPSPGAMESNPRPGMGVCGTLGVVRDTCWGVTVCDCVDDTEIERAR